MLLACFAWLVRLCTRVELGGLKACGVFAPVFILLLLSFAHLLCSLPFLLSLYLPDRVALSLCLCGSLGVVVVSFFPFGLHAKRKGAISCVLSWCVVGCVSLVPCVLLLAF